MTERLPLAALSVALGAALVASPARAQQGGATVTGIVRDAATHAPVPGALVLVEGATPAARAASDTAGVDRLTRVPPGPQTIRVQRIGYAPGRVTVVVPGAGVLARDLEVAVAPLRMQRVTVTADPVGRARGELGTASVIDRDAIVNQTASSVAGLLELVPGTPLAPPGLDGVQQTSLRSVPTSQDFTDPNPSASRLAAFGTPIILDGVPISNNANLQSLGPRGEFLLNTSAGGGVDLRRLPASTVERLEVVRGIPSARYGDLTQGVIVVDTRAGAVRPLATARFDARTGEANALGGWTLFGGRQVLSGNVDVARTRLAPGLREDAVTRVAFQVAHRATLGAAAHSAAGGSVDDTAATPPRLVLDTRLDAYSLRQDSPERPTVDPGRVSWTRDYGGRLSERARLRLFGRTQLTVNGALDRATQDAFSQVQAVRGALPFTDLLTEGRAIGHYIGGPYLAAVRLQGAPWLAYGRAESETPLARFGFDQTLRAGAELRREWNDGPGYQFDVEFPPQTTFNGVQGFDRPRRYDAVPPLAASAFYVDDRLVRPFSGTGFLSGGSLEMQAGLRADLLHSGGSFGGVRDAVLQPRLNVQLAPAPWVRLRGGWGRTAKLPSLADLYPAPQYFDVVNVNWYTPNPAERLAVLTTSRRDPTNPDLGFSVATKQEAGIELTPGWRDAVLAVTVYRDRTAGAIGIHPVPGFLPREHYQLSDSTLGTGVPPTIIEPASSVDTVPYLLQQPANNLALRNHGLEATLVLPELSRVRTRLEVQGAMTWSRLEQHDLDFGRSFTAFQVDERIPRAPYWDAVTRTGQRGIITYRVIHHQPELGLVITATVQQNLRETHHDAGSTDSLAYAGYITRAGVLVPVPAEQRANPEYADLRREPRAGIFLQDVGPPNDWMMSLQVSKTIPLDGRLSFYAFNVLDRLGKFPTGLNQGRQYLPMRVGLELSMPLGRAAGKEGGA